MDKEGYIINKKGEIDQGVLTILNVHELNNIASGKTKTKTKTEE